jgi:hypothetical protein
MRQSITRIVRPRRRAIASSAAPACPTPSRDRRLCAARAVSARPVQGGTTHCLPLGDSPIFASRGAGLGLPHSVVAPDCRTGRCAVALTTTRPRTWRNGHHCQTARPTPQRVQPHSEAVVGGQQRASKSGRRRLPTASGKKGNVGGCALSQAIPIPSRLVPHGAPDQAREHTGRRWLSCSPRGEARWEEGTPPV